MGHWSSSKYSTDYEDEDGVEVNQPMSSPKHEEYPLPMEEPTDEEEEEASLMVEKEEEVLAEDVDNITETIPGQHVGDFQVRISIGNPRGQRVPYCCRETF